ncbi:MAG: hypothetical protein AAFX99_30415, partial [Myxococcota bacterium]
GLELLAGVVWAALFLIPVLWRTADWRAAGAMVVVAGGAWIALTLGFAIQLGAGVANFGESPASRAHGGESLAAKIGRMDAGGGLPAAFYLSPAVGLVGALALMFLFKLSVVDEYFANGTSRLFWSGCAITLAATGVSIGVARRYFVRHYPWLLARFYEADLIQLDTGYAYHQSVTQGRRGLMERLVPGRVLPHYRKDRLQFGRRYPMLRILHGVFWLLFAVGLRQTWLAPWMQTAAPLAYLALIAAPWMRLYGAELEPGMLRKLPAKAGGVWLGKVLVMVGESLLVAFPAALLVLVLAQDPLTALITFLTPLGPLPLLASVAGRFGPTPAWWTGLVVAAAALALGAFVHPWATVGIAVVGLPGLVLMPRLRAHETPQR